MVESDNRGSSRNLDVQEGAGTASKDVLMSEDPVTLGEEVQESMGEVLDTEKNTELLIVDESVKQTVEGGIDLENLDTKKGDEEEQLEMEE